MGLIAGPSRSQAAPISTGHGLKVYAGYAENCLTHARRRPPRAGRRGRSKTRSGSTLGISPEIVRSRCSGWRWSWHRRAPDPAAKLQLVLAGIHQSLVSPTNWQASPGVNSNHIGVGCDDGWFALPASGMATNRIALVLARSGCAAADLSVPPGSRPSQRQVWAIARDTSVHLEMGESNR